MGQIRQARLNILIELQFWVDKIIVSDLDWGNPLHDAPALDIAYSLGSSREKGQDTLTQHLGGGNLHSSNCRSHLHLKSKSVEDSMM